MNPLSGEFVATDSANGNDDLLESKEKGSMSRNIVSNCNRGEEESAKEKSWLISEVHATRHSPEAREDVAPFRLLLWCCTLAQRCLARFWHDPTPDIHRPPLTPEPPHVT